MREMAVVVVVLAALGASCGESTESAARGTSVETTTSVTSVESTFPDIPDALPARGVATHAGDGVELYSLEGELLGTLPGMTLSSATVPGGHLYVYRYEPPSSYSATYRVDIDERRYVAVDDGALDQGELAIPPPAAPAGVTVVGHWRWTVPRDDGVALAQWSGECEVPSAFFVRPDGTSRSVLGGDWIGQPSTIAMGWLPDGRALIDVWGESGCGTASPEPGRYAIDPVTLERERTELPAGVLWSY